MKLKTSLFNRTVFTNMLRRYWVGFALYLFILGACVVTPLLNTLQQSYGYALTLPHYAAIYQLLSSSISPIIVVNFFTVAVAATLLFSYLYNPRHTGMMASLPLKRETVYCSVSAAAIFGMTLCNLVVLAFALVIELIYGQVHLGALGLLLLISILTIIAFFGMAAFCCMLTGNILAGPAVYCIFNVLSVCVEVVVNGLLLKIVYGISHSFSPITTFLSPVYQIGNSVNFSCEQIHDATNKWIDYTWKVEGLGILAIYTAVGLLFLYFGLLLYKNRRMETAGDTIAIEILKPIFRFCMTVGSGLLFAIYVSELFYQITPTKWMAAAYLAVLLIIGGVLGYFVSQMLITKTINVFRSGWKTVGIYAIGVLLVVTAVETNLFGFETYVPAASEIKEIRITGYGDDIVFDEPENIETILQLHSNIIANKDFHETEKGSSEDGHYLGALVDPNAEFNKWYIQIHYTLENDKTVNRTYQISYTHHEIRNPDSEICVYEALLNTPEGIEERYTVDFPVTMDNIEGGWVEFMDMDSLETNHFADFSPGDLARLYNECILPDIADSNLGVIHIIEDKEYAQSKYNCTIGFDIYEKLVDTQHGMAFQGYKTIQVYPTLDSSRTMAFLKEFGIEPAVVYDSMVARGYEYNDLGFYRIDGKDEPDVIYNGAIVTKEAAVETVLID